MNNTRKKGLAFLLIFLLPASVFGQVEENLMKAVAIEQISRFLEWSNETEITDTLKSFVVIVYNDNQFSTLLEEVYINRKIKNKKVEILHVSILDDISDCSILYVSKVDKSRLSEVIRIANHKRILTISGTEGFAQQGVAINFVTVGGRLKFEINQKALNDAGIKASARLLSLAIIVRNGVR